MQCNIDATGRRIRRNVGIACLAIATVLLVIVAVWWNLALLIVGGTFFAAGALCIWQARAGYCVVRGMGFRTPV